MIQKSAATLLAAFAYTVHGATPLDTSTPEQAHPPLPHDEAGKLPGNAFQVPPAVGSPFRLFRNTSQNYRVDTKNLNIDPSIRPTDTLRVDAMLPDFRGQFPLLQRGFAPETADLKVGPLYFKLRQLSAGVIWSDNIRHDNANRESETNGFVSIGGQVIWQITEEARIVAAGNFVWRPFEDESHVTGFTLRSLGLASTPVARTQATWEPIIAGIPWVFSDEFRMGTGRYTDAAYDSFELFEGFQTEDDSDRSRIFAFRGSGNPSATRSEEFGYFSNEISAATTAKVSGDFNFHFRADHEDLWYPDNDDETGLPSQRNTVSAGLESYRESLRFKPYANYRLSQRDNPDRTYHTSRVGLRGPITDLIKFDGNVGYSLEDKTSNEGWLWHTRLEHTVNPRTRHSVSWSRNVYDLSDEISQHVLYQFDHVLGPGLSTELFGGYFWTEELSGNNPDREDLRAGVRATWRVSPRTTVRLWGQYTDISRSDDSFHTKAWRGRFELSHRLYDRLSTRLVYQHTNLDSIRGTANSYDENLLYFTTSYSFE